MVAFAFAWSAITGNGQIRDGGIDPWNLGKGCWVYSMKDATNKLGGHIAAVTNETSLMRFYQSQGVRYFIVKAATNDKLFGDCYAGPQFTSNLVATAHANGILIFGYNRSYGSNILGEVAIADYVFSQGADGFVFDAESEWETGHAWITNGPAQAWQLCSTVRAHWPNKFLAHAPFPIIYLHASFPYKEFGFWCDAVMPQIYHFSSAGIKSSPSAAINWSDANWSRWQKSLAALAPTNINGLTVYWTNAIKPIVPLQDVYGEVVPGGIICEGAAGAVYPDADVMEFIDYSAADPNAQTVGGYCGANFWRADTIGVGQWSGIQAGTIGDFPGKVSNIVLDDAKASIVGPWNFVLTFNVTNQTSPGFVGATGSDTNSFGTNYFSKPQGNGSAYVQFTPNILSAGAYDVFQWHPYVTNASTATPFAITHASGTSTVLANQQTNSGNWSLLGRFYFNAGTNGNIRILDNFSDAGSLALADGIKLVFVPGTGPPRILQHPQSVTNTAGMDTTFQVTADGSAPLSCQWFLNNTAISGATNLVLTRTSIQAADAGYYRAVISNPLGSRQSSNALLTVLFRLTTTTLGRGSVSVEPSQSAYFPGTPVTLTATPEQGFVFAGWSGDFTSSSNPGTVAMTDSKQVLATFLNTNTDIILDNTNAEVSFVGTWTLGNSAVGRYQNDYAFSSSATGGTNTATYRPLLGNAGYYDVFIWYPPGGNRATNSPWQVSFLDGSTNVLVNQQSNGGAWLRIASARPFGTGANGFVRLSNNAGPSVVIADAVRFLYLGPLYSAPLISLQPLGQSVKTGSTATFSAAATGVPAPTWQWKFNGSNIFGATSSSFVRTNVQLGDSGNYSVIASNIAGTCTSSNAFLTVQPIAPLRFQGIAARPGGGVDLLISGEPGYWFSLDRAPNLANWLPLTNIFNSNGTVFFTDDSATNSEAGFYRARQ